MSKVLVSRVIGILVLSLCTGSAAFAGWVPITHVGHSALSVSAITTVAAPEIDPAGAFSGLTLLLGGLAVVRGRRFKK